MRTLAAEPLTAEAFAPYGTVIAVPDDFTRRWYADDLENARADAKPMLSVTHVRPMADRPHRAVLLERHEFSSQSFVPIDCARYLVIVAPYAAAGGPDAGRARAFVATGQQGVTYRRGAWHHGLTALDRPATFAVFMWRDGSQGDEEFVPLAEADRFAVTIPDP